MFKIQFKFISLLLIPLFLNLIPIKTLGDDFKTLSVPIKHYFDIQKALASDSLDKAKFSGLALKTTLENEIKNEDIPVNKKVVLQDLLNEVPKFLAATNLGEIRIAFGTISKIWVTYFKANPSEAKGYSLFFCPMFPKGYAFWIQPQQESLSNPYWGKEMLECGVKRPWK